MSTGVYAETVHIDDIKNVGGRDILIKNIGVNSVIFQVGEVKDLVSIGASKEIVGIKIEVNSIFYVEEKESRYADVDLSSSISCGDGTCTAGLENQLNCCDDCGCSSGETCNNNRCGLSHLDKCRGNNDCDDKNDKTFDLCSGKPRVCFNRLTVECSVNEDCKDDNSCTQDLCESDTCFNKPISDCNSNSLSAGLGDQESVVGDEVQENIENKKIENEKVGFFKRLILKIKNWF